MMVKPVGHRKLLRLGKLSLNGLFPLPVAGIAGINNSVHSCFASFTGSRSKASRAVFLSFSDALS